MIIYDPLDSQEAHDTIVALRNEAHACDVLGQVECAIRLRTHASRLERRMFAHRPISYKAARVDVQIESPAVEAFVTEYRGQ